MSGMITHDVAKAAKQHNRSGFKQPYSYYRNVETGPSEILATMFMLREHKLMMGNVNKEETNTRDR
jgi:hypothetical protein